MRTSRTDVDDYVHALDEQSFRTLFEQHYRAVLAYALRRTSDAAEAQDVVAETFLTAWRRRGDLSGSPLPWLYGIARRVLANHRRATRRRERATRELAAVTPLGRRPEAEESLEYADVLAALARLRPVDREVLRLAAWEGLAPREIAPVFGCSANAAAIRLHRARARLQAELAKERPPTGHSKAGTPKEVYGQR